MNSFHPYQQRCRDKLEAYLHEIPDCPPGLNHALAYSTLQGGKFLRATIVYLVGESLGCAMDKLDAPASAIELVHSYSLVHDDLPCMDNADTRRGQPSCHRAFDEATAVLVGDALQSRAFELLANDHHHNAETKVHMMAQLAKAIGPSGMVAGQYLDIEGQQHTQAALEHMHKLKTGALILASAQLAVLASGYRHRAEAALIEQFAVNIGLAYQVHDDLLDVTSDAQKLGKPTQQDQDKISFMSLMSIDDAKALINDLSQQAMKSIKHLGDPADKLLMLAEQLTQRVR